MPEPVLQDEEPPPSDLANALTELWQNAQDRETGSEAIEAIRARRQQELGSREEKQGGRWPFGRGG